MYGVIIKKLLWGSVTGNIIKDLLESFLGNYQKELQIIKGSVFNFESVELMDYKLHKVPLKRGGSYIKSPEWLVNKRATINPKNKKDDKRFQYALPLALDYNEIKKKELERIFKKIKYEDKDIPSHQRDWKIFEQNNQSIALNVLFASQNSEEITLVYKSEHNFKQENNVLLLMINDNEKYYYFTAKSKLESYSSEWLKSKKESINKEDDCLQSALNDSLDYQMIKKHPQKISKLKPYINHKDILIMERHKVSFRQRRLEKV